MRRSPPRSHPACAPWGPDADAALVPAFCRPALRLRLRAGGPQYRVQSAQRRPLSPLGNRPSRLTSARDGRVLPWDQTLCCFSVPFAAFAPQSGWNTIRHSGHDVAAPPRDSSSPAMPAAPQYPQGCSVPSPSECACHIARSVAAAGATISAMRAPRDTMTRGKITSALKLPTDIEAPVR